MCGITLSAANFVRMWLMRYIFHSDTTTPVFFVVCISMVLTVILAKTIGCTLPIVAKAMHLDPALMAGPMITTIVDAFSLLIYFGIATAFISGGFLVG